MKIRLSTNEAAGILYKNSNSNWSSPGAFALIEWLEQLESEIGEVELDPVALSCDFCEYASAVNAAADYGWEPNPNLGDAPQTDDDKNLDAIDWLQDHTQVIEFDGGVIIQRF